MAAEAVVAMRSNRLRSVQARWAPRGARIGAGPLHPAETRKSGGCYIRFTPRIVCTKAIAATERINPPIRTPSTKSKPSATELRPKRCHATVNRHALTSHHHAASRAAIRRMNPPEARAEGETVAEDCDTETPS